LIRFGMVGDPLTRPPIPALHPEHEHPALAGRLVALLEVLLCSDYPTQLALASTFAALGYRPTVNGHLSVAYVASLSLLDTALLLGLILLFVRAHGERPREVFVGTRSPWTEAMIGVPLTLAATAIAAVVLGAIRFLAPSLHNVAQNPLQALMHGRRDALVFGLVVVVAGGIREEIQRVFLLRRFEVWLGGAGVGIVVTSVLFGAGHQLQGTDAAVATGVLGAFWATVYLLRRSSVAPIVSHSGFNLLRIGQFLITGA
jgi:membrane protease YdiL (CAAX protease family)